MDITTTNPEDQNKPKAQAVHQGIVRQSGLLEINDLGLIRLLQLSSVSLPVGGYAFSQGMEYAIDRGWIRNSHQVNQWVSEQLMFSLACTDLPLLRLNMLAMEQMDNPMEEHEEVWLRLQELNDLALACRETKELRLTDTAMGEALGRLLRNLDMRVPFSKSEDVSFVSLFAFAANQWQISYRSAATGFVWSWLENQIAAATKLVPLGQTQAQQLLTELQSQLVEAIDKADTITEQQIGNGLPALSIASARHEHMYSRLFRS